MLRNCLYPVGFFLGLILFFQPLPEVRADLSNRGTQELFQEMDGMIARNQYRRALPLLVELKERRLPAQARERVLFNLTISQLLNNNLEASVESADLYLQEFPEEEPERFIILFKADALRGLGRFEDALTILDQIRARNRWRNYPGEYRVEVIEKRAETLFLMRDWEQAYPALQELLANVSLLGDQLRIQETRLRASSYIVQTLIGLGRLDEAFRSIPELAGDSDARFDLAFNFSLIEGGDQMFAQERFLEALAFYQTVILPDEIAAFFQRRLEILATQPATTANLANRRMIEQRLASLDQVPEDLLPGFRWRLGQSYYRLNRLNEAYWSFRRVWDEYPDHAFAEDALFGSFNSAVQLGRMDRVREIGERYLADPRTIKYYDVIASQLLRIYQQEGNRAAITTLSAQLLESINADPVAEQAPTAITLLGQAWSELGQISDIASTMNQLAELHPNTPTAEAALYWAGLAAMQQRDFRSGQQQFERLIAQNPDSRHAEEATFRLAVTKLAQNQLDEARQSFVRFLERYPESLLRAEALGYLGDIGFHTRDREMATRYYTEALEAATAREGTPVMAVVDKVHFQKATMARQDGQHSKITELLESYLNDFSSHASPMSLSRATSELGQAYRARGQDERMLELYLTGIREFGNLRDSFGVDDMIVTVARRYAEIRGYSPFDTLIDIHQNALLENERTLELRAIMALDMIGREVRSELLESDAFIQHASPATLAWFGEKIIDQDQEKARLAFQQLLQAFPRSDDAITALLGEARFLAREGRYRDAHQLFEEAIRRFPRNPRIVEARLGRAAMLTEMGQYDDAITEYQAVNANRAWRSSWAESNFRMAQAMTRANRPEEAVVNFQRVFIMYPRSEFGPDAYLEAGKLLEQLGRRDQARNVYREMLENPRYEDTPQRAEIQQRLSRLPASN